MLHAALRISGCVVIALVFAAFAEEEPFAADEGESPAQSLRKALRKMSRVEESARTWLERSGADAAGQAPPAELLTGISTRQKEIADDLSRLVLKLQKGEEDGTPLPIPGGDPNSEQSSSGQGSSSSQQTSETEGQKRQENPQRGEGEESASGSEPLPEGGDPARDIYSAQYRHRLIERLKPAGDGSRSWGNLPEKMRDQMSGGSQEEFVPAYEGLTREYYKRIQEEARKEPRQ